MNKVEFVGLTGHIMPSDSTKIRCLLGLMFHIVLRWHSENTYSQNKVLLRRSYIQTSVPDKFCLLGYFPNAVATIIDHQAAHSDGQLWLRAASPLILLCVI